MDKTSAFIILLLVIRIALDILALATRNSSYRFEFAYFLVFAAAGIVILSQDYSDLWGQLALGVAIFSLIQFFIRRGRHASTHSDSTT